MRYALVDARMDTEMLHTLFSFGFEPICMPPCSTLPEPVAAHPDMLLFLFNKELYTSEKYYTANRKLFDKIKELTGFSAHPCDEEHRPEYPHDVVYNCLELGGKIYGHKGAAAALRSLAPFIPVRQGYAACSTLRLDDTHIITADCKIAEAVRANGGKALAISAGGVSLPPYDCGFIGGASGVLDDTVYFMGDISSHPDARQICELIYSLGMKIQCLSASPLRDYGKIFFL